MWNAFTYLDWTTYFETMPAASIDLALRLEADRMVNSLFEPEEVASERTVIISEREGNENEPLFRLGEEIQAACIPRAFLPPRGDRRPGRPGEDAARGSFGHYRQHYVPNNAVLAIAGDFETEAC